MLQSTFGVIFPWTASWKPFAFSFCVSIQCFVVYQYIFLPLDQCYKWALWALRGKATCKRHLGAFYQPQTKWPRTETWSDTMKIKEMAPSCGASAFDKDYPCHMPSVKDLCPLFFPSPLPALHPPQCNRLGSGPTVQQKSSCILLQSWFRLSNSTGHCFQAWVLQKLESNFHTMLTD